MRWIAIGALFALTSLGCAAEEPASDDGMAAAVATTAAPPITVQSTPATVPPTTMAMDETGEHDGMAEQSGAHETGDVTADSTAPHGDADYVLEVTLTDFAFEPDSFAVSAGDTVEFVLTNVGAIEHEFRITTAHEAEEHLAGGHDDHHGAGDDLVLVAAGETMRWTYTFAEDSEVDLVACLLPGHFEAGMKAALTVG